MFSPVSWEKGSLTLTDNPSQGRSKFSVGINSLEDESQTSNRIQLAVHRYNNTAGGSFVRPVNDRNVSSPFKQAFLKHSPKCKNFESDKDDGQNNASRPHNQYQGVGNFPVVHLKKSAIISKPVKRISTGEFKIQLPELPFNRFLNHSPDICLDTKTSTRSVLDVLQDLSRKRIHTKDDTEASKRKCKGLGGDAPMDIEAPYRPLFVPKTKSNTVTYRDSTTQTQELPSLCSSPSKKCVAVLPNEKDDPKAELRRRLARQNNEIFASLSSSTLSYPIKRIREKSSQGKVSDQQDEVKAKRAKYFVDENNDKTIQNGNYVLNNSLCGNSSEQANKSEKKQKMGEGSKISPNKDRLTAIFIDMQNINPKLEVLGKKQELNGKEDTKWPKSIDLEKSNNGSSPTVEHVSQTDISQKKEDNSEATNKNDRKLALPLDNDSSSAMNKIGDEKTAGLTILNVAKENILSNINDSQKTNVVSSALISASSIPTTTTMNFGFKIASTISSSLNQTPILSTGILQKPANENLTLRGSSEATAVITEAVNNDTTAENKDIQKDISSNSVVQSSVNVEGSTEVGSKTSSPSTFFKFGAADGVQTEVSAPEQKNNTETSSKTIGPGFFKFGSSELNVQSQSLPSESKLALQPTTCSTENLAKSSPGIVGGTSLATTQTTLFAFPNVSTSPFTLSTITTTTTTFSQSLQNTPSFTFSDKKSPLNKGSEKPPTLSFGFGQSANNSSVQLFNADNSATTKPESNSSLENKSDNKNDADKGISSSTTTTSTFTHTTLQSTSFTTPIFGQSGTSSQPNNQNILPFKFGEKTDVPKPENSFSSGSSTNIFDQKPKSGIFTFGQKTQNAPTTSGSQPAVSQPSMLQSNVFSFGQKPAVTTNSTSQSSESTDIFGQKPASRTSLFEQPSVSQASTTSNPIVNSTSPFGITTTASSTGIMNNTFSQNKLGIPAFGQSTPSFEHASTSFSSETNVFGGNSGQNTPAFGSTAPAQSSPFTQTFGDNANKQQNSSGQSSNFFMQPTATQTSGFAQNTGFGSTTFGQNTGVENNVFGQKNVPQIGGFDQNQNQASPFGQSSTSQTFGSQAPFTFGASATTSTTSGFSLNTSTTASVFTFGGSTKTTTASSSNFGFNASAQTKSGSQSMFSFNSQPSSSAFKFGASPAKETPNFGAGTSTSGFTFNATPSTSETPKPAAPVFNFSSTQNTPSNTGFNFGASQSPVFSFGGSSASSNSSTFSFGATQSTPGIFTPGATPSPSVPLQGKFSIGAAPSQPRNRNLATRARRKT